MYIGRGRVLNDATVSFIKSDSYRGRITERQTVQTGGSKPQYNDDKLDCLTDC